VTCPFGQCRTVLHGIPRAMPAATFHSRDINWVLQPKLVQRSEHATAYLARFSGRHVVSLELFDGTSGLLCELVQVSGSRHSAAEPGKADVQLFDQRALVPEFDARTFAVCGDRSFGRAGFSPRRHRHNQRRRLSRYGHRRRHLGTHGRWLRAVQRRRLSPQRTIPRALGQRRTPSGR
jgi:hypothetical protein